jgi:HD-GYP domain-containing protein (c-di-GMP phosphodiesterase class II)
VSAGGDAQPVVLALGAGLGVASIYPSEHPRIAEAADRLARELGRFLATRPGDDLTLFCVDDELVVDGRPLRQLGMQLRPLLRVLQRRRVQRVTLASGLTGAECRQFLEALVGRGELVSMPRLVLGRLLLGERPLDGAEHRGEDHDSALPLSERDIDVAEDAYASFVGDGGAVEHLDRIVWRFMDGLARTSRSLLLLAPIRNRAQASFVHAMNVALLTVAQGRALGIEGPALHDLGVAGMLHDIGKTRLPPGGGSRRDGRFDDEGWAQARRHPELGAALLAGIDDVPPVAVQVAYEHHLRWDGGPSYPESARGRFPSFATQIVAVADTYDTIVASRRLGATQARRAAFHLWRERAGTWLDPLLVAHFVLLVSAGDGAVADAATSSGLPNRLSGRSLVSRAPTPPARAGRCAGALAS